MPRTLAPRALAASALVLFVGLSLPHAGRAAEPASAAKKALIQKMLQLQQPAIEGVARTLVGQPIAPLMQQVTGFIEARVPADKREAVAKDLQGDFKRYGESTTLAVRDRAMALAPSTIGEVMDQRFTEDDLRELVAWLESPVARKYQAALPDFQRALVDRLVADTRPTVEPRLKELNATVTRKLSAAAASPAPAKP
jgi:hypothetical protein